MIRECWFWVGSGQWTQNLGRKGAINCFSQLVRKAIADSCCLVNESWAWGQNLQQGRAKSGHKWNTNEQITISLALHLSVSEAATPNNANGNGEREPVCACTNMEILNLLADPGARTHQGASSDCSGTVAKTNRPLAVVEQSHRETLGHHRSKHFWRTGTQDGTHPASSWVFS